MFEKVRDIIVETLSCEADEVTMEASLTDDLGADSLDLVELIMSVEEAFELGQVEDNTLENVKTVGDVVNFIKERVEE